jgi:hypothetical protein
LSELHLATQSILSGTEGGGFNHNDNLMLNFPLLKGTLAVRVVATEAHTSGWIPRIVSNEFPLVSSDGSTRGNVLAAPVSARYNQSNAVDRRYSFDMIYGGNYGGATNTNPITGHYARLPGYSLTNFRVGLESPGGTWGASLFANNVFNKHAQLENMFILTLYSCVHHWRGRGSAAVLPGRRGGADHGPVDRSHPGARTSRTRAEGPGGSAPQIK